MITTDHTEMKLGVGEIDQNFPNYSLIWSLALGPFSLRKKDTDCPPSQCFVLALSCGYAQTSVLIVDEAPVKSRRYPQLIHVKQWQKSRINLHRQL